MHGPRLARSRVSAHAAQRSRGHLGVRIVAALLAAPLLFFATGLTAAAAYAYDYYARITQDLPAPETITQHLETFQTIKIYDRNGVLLHELYDPNRGKRIELPLAQFPPVLTAAFLAAEDAHFYENSGVDFRAIARAAFENYRTGERVQGASTITQQLVKNTLLSDERTYERKIREALLALSVSKRYSKDQILEMYLNSVFLGNQAFGVGAAAEIYFGKPIQQLTLPEAAVLAGLPRSPSETNPLADPAAARAEQQRVLDAMVLHGYLSEEEASAASEQPLVYNDHPFAEAQAPHFVEWVRQVLEANPKYGGRALYERGLHVTTTLDLNLQNAAQQIVRDNVASLGRYNVTDGALAALNPATGEVLAMVGSADYNNRDIQGQVNVALALRQPGSSIKPITYLAAFLKGWSPATIIDDAPTDFPIDPYSPPYKPKNYDGAFHGKVTARTALANSYNIPAVKALQFVGVPGLVDLAGRMGITTFREPSRYGLALTLGGGEVRLLELAGAYGVLANGGRSVPPIGVLEVRDNQGRVLDRFDGPRPKAVVDAAHAYLITSILSDNAARTSAFGPNSPLKLSRPAAVKTGTTDDYKDNWTVGYTSQLVAGVWVGNADNAAMRGTTGITGAAPIWHDFMELALSPLPVDPLDPPAGVQKLAIGRTSGKLWTDQCPEPKLEDYLVSGTAPREKCELPTPTPSPTAAPATATPFATSTPWPTSTPDPLLEARRAQVQATATALAEAFSTRMADIQRGQAASAQTATAVANRSLAQRQASDVAVAATRSTVQASPTPIPSATRTSR